MSTVALPFQVPPPLPVCGVCGSPLRPEQMNTPTPVPCPSCGARGLARVFPALFRPLPEALTGEDLAVVEGNGEGEAACYFHAGKRAAVPCDRCGRFLCRLCDLDFGDGRHLCPECLRAGRQEGGLTELVNERPVRDRVTLLLACVGVFWALFAPVSNLVGGIFLIVFSLVPAAAALFLCARHWGDASAGPAPTVGPRLRFVAALILGVGVVLTWGGWAGYHMTYGFN